VFSLQCLVVCSLHYDIAEVICPLGWPLRLYGLILTDSLSSIKAMLSRKIAHRTHPLVYECMNDSENTALRFFFSV
jgi:hypothetical protein